jgi:hypothetical protein
VESFHIHEYIIKNMYVQENNIVVNKTTTTKKIILGSELPPLASEVDRKTI